MPNIRRAHRRQRPSVLIIQADSDKLAANGLDLSAIAGFTAQVAGLISEACAHVATTTTFESFRNLVEHVGAQGRWDVVVLIGHSNSDGFKIASDKFLVWEDVASELRVLGPRRIILIACRGGRSPGANQLFRRLSSLRRIYACPVNCTKELGAVLLGLVPWVVETKAPRPDAIRNFQLLAALGVGGQVRHWQRDLDRDNPDGQLLDFLADAIDPIVRSLPEALSSFFTRQPSRRAYRAP